MSHVEIRSSRYDSFLGLLSPARLARGVWASRGLLGQFVWREVAQRHKGTHLGLLWSLISPLLTLGVYTFLFGVVFRVRWGELADEHSHPEYALTLFCGLIFFTVFQEAANKSASLIVERPNFVRKVVFPLEVLPAAVVGTSLAFALVEIAILLVAVGVVFHSFSLTAVFAPLVFVPLIMMSLGVAWFLASLGVFIRDIRQVVTVVVQLLFFMTPIFYPMKNVPEAYQPVLRLNPMTTIVENARRTLMWNEMPDWVSLGVVTLVGAVMMQLGYAWFMKTKKGFADVL